MIWLALALDYAALLAFALGMEIHHRAILGRVPSAERRRAWKCVGGALLVLALAASVGALGVTGGPVLWFVAWAGGGLVLTLLLERAPRISALPALVCLTAAAISVAVTQS